MTAVDSSSVFAALIGTVASSRSFAFPSHFLPRLPEICISECAREGQPDGCQAVVLIIKVSDRGNHSMTTFGKVNTRDRFRAFPCGDDNERTRTGSSKLYGANVSGKQVVGCRITREHSESDPASPSRARWLCFGTDSWRGFESQPQPAAGPVSWASALRVILSIRWMVWFWQQNVRLASTANL